MKKKPSRLFEPINKKLWDESEKHKIRQKELWKEMSINRANTLLPQIKTIQDKHYSGEKLTPEDFEIIENIIDDCQGWLFRDRAGMDILIPELYKLYEKLIIKIVKRFCENKNINIDKKDKNNDLDDWLSYAQLYFYRSITGDLPETIKVFENEDDKKHSLELMTSLFNHNLSKLKTEKRKYFDDQLVILKESGISNEELENVKLMFESEMEDFSKSVNDKPFELDFNSWVRSRLEHKLNVHRVSLRDSLSEEWRDVCRTKIKIYETLLENKAAFEVGVNTCRESLKKDYAEYIKNVYSDHRYNKSYWNNFTVFLETTIPSTLNDIYRGEAYKNSQLPEDTIFVSNEKEEDTENGPKLDWDKISHAYYQKSEENKDIQLSDFDEEIKKLSPNQKQIIEYIKEGYSQEEIAKKMNVTPARISVQIQTIAKWLKPHRDKFIK